jgi:hypothetical protein
MAVRTAGCRRGLVNTGGDLAVMIELKNAALATSDVCSAAKPIEQRGYYHGGTGTALLEIFDARLVAHDFVS